MDDQILDQEVVETRNSLATDRLDMSFGEIMSMYGRDEIIIDPEFQRLFRWTNYQQTRFIESLLLGIPIPPIFVAEDNNGKWELVDGLQRISTVFSFFGILKSYTEKNNWILCEGDLIKSFADYSCNNLPLKFQLNIKRAVCRVEIIKWNSKIDMRYELFNRLNTGGSPLTDQEIRNCIFRGISNDFNNFLKRVAQDHGFVKLIDPTERQLSELYLEELVLRFASLYNNYSNVKEILSKHMTEYMRDIIKSGTFDYNNEILFNRTLILLKPLGKDIFRAVNGVFSTSLYDAITIGVASNIDFYEKQGATFLQEKITGLKNDEDFKSYTGSAANSKIRVINRLKIAEKTFNPI